MGKPLLHDLPPLIRRYRWRSRVGTALVIGLVGGTLGVVWYYVLRAPGPRRVCDHVEWIQRNYPSDSHGITDALAPRGVSGSGPAVATSRDQACMWYFATERKQRGYFGYGQLARCVLFAETPRALHPCVR